jgi:D-alanyl-lipoteichoic acid acyltransferase DltB (MBOAT superfamily)
MLFNSVEFLFGFLPLCVLVYFCFGHRGSFSIAIAWLAFSSLAFYAWWNPGYLLLLLASIGFNYGVGRVLGRHPVATQTDRVILVSGIGANLLLLAYYKYAGFFVANLNSVVSGEYSIPEIVLPLGISFFTFTQIAYLVDAYRKEVREFSFLNYLLFVTFFPHLIAGPVLHHAEIMPQFRDHRIFRLNSANIAVGFSIFFVGLFKKLLIADSAAKYATPVFLAAQSGEVISGWAAWGGALAYTFQIYFDFSGYSDMAIGLARIFGVRFPGNFYSPYKATSIIDFWRRWHMTLSRFLRDYLYIPLGGSYCPRYRARMNLAITMLLGGFWHGAGWTFVIWGGLHGSYLIVNHYWRDICASTASRKSYAWSRMMSILGGGLTFLCVVVAWVFFRADSVPAALAILKGMAGLNGFAYKTEFFRGMEQIKLLMICALIVWFAPNIQQIFIRYRPTLEVYTHANFALLKLEWVAKPVWAIILGIGGAIAVMNISEGSEFLYFQF